MACFIFSHTIGTDTFLNAFIMKYTIARQNNIMFQGLVAFYDSRDMRSCVGWCQWSPKGGVFGVLDGYSTNQYPRSIPVYRPRFYSNYTASISAHSIILRASTVAVQDKTSVFMHLGSNSTGGLCSLSQSRDTIYYCNRSLISNISVATDPSFDFALVSNGSSVSSIYVNGIVESSRATTSGNTTAAGLYIGRSGDGNIDSGLDGSLVYLIILNRSVSGAEVARLVQWSDNVHNVGASNFHFAIGVWNSFSSTTLNLYYYNIIWRVSPSARPAFSRTISFLLRLPDGGSSSRNLLLFSAPAAFSSRRFGIDWIYNSTESSQLYLYDAMDSISVNGSFCSIAGSGSMKVDVVVTPATSGSGSNILMYVNHVLQTGFSTSWSSVSYAGDVLTRQSNRLEVGDDAQFQHLRVLSYAASDVELTRPCLLSIVTTSSTARLTTVTVSGCCFTIGLPCSLLMGGVTVSVSCSILSAVQASIDILPNSQYVSPSLTHDGKVFVLEEIQTSAAT
jgi:hypothetical protein